MVRYRSQEVEVGGAVYQVRAQSKEDSRVQVQVQVRGGEEAVGELVAPADHLAALGRAVGEVDRAFGGRAWTVTDARHKHRAAYTRWTEEHEARLASEAARNRTVRNWPTYLDASRAQSRAAFATSTFVIDHSPRACSYREVTNTWPISVADTDPCRGSVPIERHVPAGRQGFAALDASLVNERQRKRGSRSRGPGR
jgi:hypothetical protein